MSDNRPGILWLVIDEPSRDELRRLVPPRYQNLYYHHITLLYGVEREAVEQMIGQRRSVTARAVAYNARAQAVRVDIGDLPDTYGVPHLTLSAQVGIKPFASVAMLQGEHEEMPLEPPIPLTGVLEFIYIDEVHE